MVVLDATIVNIALPSAQRVLGFMNVDRQRVVTAHALAFVSLLLFGGRLGDLIGARSRPSTVSWTTTRAYYFGLLHGTRPVDTRRNHW